MNGPVDFVPGVPRDPDYRSSVRDDASSQAGLAAHVFKVGDRVRTRAVDTLARADHGLVGVIDSICPDAAHPYGVTLDGDNRTGCGPVFSVDEIEPETPAAEPVPSPVSAAGSTVLEDVVAAATAVVDAAPGEPGAMARRQTLEDALRELAAVDRDLDVVLAAALWIDRYGRAGAPDYLRGLGVAVVARRTGGAS